MRSGEATGVGKEEERGGNASEVGERRRGVGRWEEGAKNGSEASLPPTMSVMNSKES